MITSQVYCRPDFVPHPWQLSHLMLRASDNFLRTMVPSSNDPSCFIHKLCQKTKSYTPFVSCLGGSTAHPWSTCRCTRSQRLHKEPGEEISMAVVIKMIMQGLPPTDNAFSEGLLRTLCLRCRPPQG